MSSIGEQLSSRKHLFTPSTPYVHKFRTEMCKNYELYKKCKYGDEVSFLIELKGKCSVPAQTIISSIFNSNVIGISRKLLSASPSQNLFNFQLECNRNFNEYKRRQAPPGIRISSRAFGRDWRYPITSWYRFPG